MVRGIMMMLALAVAGSAMTGCAVRYQAHEDRGYHRSYDRDENYGQQRSREVHERNAIKRERKEVYREQRRDEQRYQKEQKRDMKKHEMQQKREMKQQDKKDKRREGDDRMRKESRDRD